MPSAVHVANQLSELTLAKLTELSLARPFQLGRQHDLHDLADTLLSAESIAPTLRGLSRPSLASLHTGSPDTACSDLLLTRPSGEIYSEVLALLPTVAPRSTPSEPAIAVTDSSTMLHTVAAIRDLLAWIVDEPLPMSATGGILKAEEKTVSHNLVIPPSEAHTVVWMVERAGFARNVDRRLRITVSGAAALDDLVGLWDSAVDAVLGMFPVSILNELRAAGRLDREFCEWVWPLRDAADTQRLEEIHQAAEMLGLVAGSTTDCGRAVLGRDTSALDAIRGAAFPELLDTVYVLDDLSIIAPGPISTPSAAALDTVSTVETRGLAAKRRLDPARILRSIANGSTVEALLAVLAAHSLTPLTSAITSTVNDIATNTRYVLLNGTGTDTAAKASHPELGEMLLTDPRLQRLAPVAVDSVSILYGASRDRVEATLIEARYTVVASERDFSPADSVPSPPVIVLAETLFEVGLGSSHLERALMVAGKARTRVTLVIETGTGPRTITLEPRQVANGRVRGLDTSADVERTLPISAILELKPAGE
jgi:hypothetical protein